MWVLLVMVTWAKTKATDLQIWWHESFRHSPLDGLDGLEGLIHATYGQEEGEVKHGLTRRSVAVF